MFSRRFEDEGDAELVSGSALDRQAPTAFCRPCPQALEGDDRGVVGHQGVERPRLEVGDLDQEESSRDGQADVGVPRMCAVRHHQRGFDESGRSFHRITASMFPGAQLVDDGVSLVAKSIDQSGKVVAHTASTCAAPERISSPRSDLPPGSHPRSGCRRPMHLAQADRGLRCALRLLRHVEATGSERGQDRVARGFGRSGRLDHVPAVEVEVVEPPVHGGEW
jgi:hypothetical protein